ncbi:uncharacterized protein EV422DRAFT_44669 [Fimicolochytrium jonesii]|uniref:uncharacterized protein n=1 Tax=Fimicolochytrium jonesii TaxID=1396493 RepID=UPI0022FDB2A4|nr:uncharacterized protein EV422DRAFT_44669 [Fimicolochytrium jonesii]KAI8821489.1 hypothetical protein EV422DRAFT_44669 [Fimicolochytrium jonesii]
MRRSCSSEMTSRRRGALSKSPPSTAIASHSPARVQTVLPFFPFLFRRVRSSPIDTPIEAPIICRFWSCLRRGTSDKASRAASMQQERTRRIHTVLYQYCTSPANLPICGFLSSTTYSIQRAMENGCGVVPLCEGDSIDGVTCLLWLDLIPRV